MPTRPMPPDDVVLASRQQIEQMTAGEARRARYENARQRGTPPSAPLKGEKLPRPARVNDMKNR